MSTNGGDELPQPPERVGPYRIESRLGVGGMGAVYRAYDQRLERPVAIKHILPEVAEDTKARARLRREARAVASLNHPSIVQIFDIVEEEGGDWIVMELVEGQTLHRLLGRGQLELGRAVDLGRQVADGLAEAHAKGIVHRDLKTENVMVTLSDRAKILDFGLAKRLWKGRADVSLSVQGSILGTSRAMSPEQAMGDPIDHRSDLFSLGSLLYEITGGRPPFMGSSIFHTLAQVCSDRQKPVREINPRVPQDLSDLIDRLLEKNPSHRPNGADEVAAELNAIGVRLRREGGSAVISVPPGAREGSVTSEGRGTGASTEHREPSQTRVVPGHTATGSIAASGIFIKTLLRLSLSDSLHSNLDGSRIYEVLSRHDRLVRDLLARGGGLEIEKADGFLLLFDRPADAVRYALEHQTALGRLGEELGLELEARVAIHLGEVFLRENSQQDITRGAKPMEIEGVTKRVVGQVEQLVRDGQILVTQSAFDLARRALAEERVEGGNLHWKNHGIFEVDGVDEPLALAEVGLEGRSDFQPPEAMPTRAHPTWAPPPERRPWVPWVVGLALVALAVWAFVSWKEPTDSDSVSRPGSGPRRAVAVLELQNLSGRPETDWLGVALAETLSAELAAGEQLRVVPGQSVARMRKELQLTGGMSSLEGETLSVVGRNLDTDYVVTGSFVSLAASNDEQVRFDLWLQSTQGTGDPTVGTVSEQGPVGEMLSLVKNAGQRLRVHLGVAAITDEQAQTVQAALEMPPDALRFYSEGLEKLRNYEVQESLSLLQQAAEVGPDLALVHAALSDAWHALGNDAKAKESARRANELAAGLARQDALEIEGRYNEVAARWDEAIKNYEALHRFFPDRVDYGLRLAEAQSTAGRGHQALATLESLRALDFQDPQIDLAEASVAYELFDYQRSLKAGRRAEKKAAERSASILEAEAFNTQGHALMQLGENEEAREVLSEAEARFAAAGDLGRQAVAMNTRATVLQYTGEVDEAEALYLQALETFRELGNRREVATVQNGLGLLYQVRGKLGKARELLEEAVAITREIGERSQEAWILDSLVWVVAHQGRLVEARRLAEEELAVYEEMGSKEGQAWAFYYLAKVALEGGEVAEARQSVEKALLLAGDEDSYQEAFLRHGLAEVLIAQGEVEAAQEALDRAFRLREELGEKDSLATTRLLRARFALQRGHYAEAAEMASRASVEFREASMPDFESSALSILARSQGSEGQESEARRSLELARAGGEKSEYPATRTDLTLATARLDAAGNLDRVLRDLDSEIRSLEEQGLMRWVLEGRLMRQRLTWEAGQGSEESLEALIRRAEGDGFLGIAERAKSLRPTP